MLERLKTIAAGVELDVFVKGREDINAFVEIIHKLGQMNKREEQIIICYLFIMTSISILNITAMQSFKRGARKHVQYPWCLQVLKQLHEILILKDSWTQLQLDLN